MGFKQYLMDKGTQVADTAINALTGGLMARYQDQRQLEQAKRLQELQLQGNKSLMAYQQDQAYQMWLKTNYPEQVKQMQQAGLNVGLMYGGSGPGGQLQQPNATVSGQQATPTQDLLSLAQMKNIEADTKLKEGQAEFSKEQSREKAIENWVNSFTTGFVDKEGRTAKIEINGTYYTYQSALTAWLKGEIKNLPSRVENDFINILRNKAEKDTSEYTSTIKFWEQKLASMGITFNDDLAIRMGLLLAKQEGVDLEDAQSGAAIYDAIMNVFSKLKLK